ncbi:DNA-binding response OmpR family regulator [Novosphingobium fluoreni]|uniref:DNA-binding response OmpR family regulator n=1 Tax=Novosphingobium fluoreni TaxID=1391222 RepID=A0A7W6BY53_9SPHN|nr:response regulator transcription factor [Novosphingobium fluoreni]MBB3938585.1 DNA-binding response OmpR family regulator [Novosphingobium fluoreni]
MSLNILLVEDDRQLQRQLREQLSGHGHEVTVADDGRAALDLISRYSFDAVVLDWMLPGMTGLDVLRQFRADGMTLPVLMLTALGQIMDKVGGLEAGADDYVVKPVDPLELNARLNALVRGRKATDKPADTISAGDIVISPTRLRVWRGEQPVPLTQIEFKLLVELARDAGTVLTRAMLIERVWGHDFVTTTNLVDAHIRQLRLKLTQFGDDPIQTVRGVGYLLPA